MKKRKELVGLIVTILLLMLVDQGSKQWATRALNDATFSQNEGLIPVCGHLNRSAERLNFLTTHATPLTVINGKLTFLYEENCHGAFGMLEDLGKPFRLLLFSSVSLIPLFFLIWQYARKHDENRQGRLALAVICGGTLANLIDLLTKGYVVDFICAYPVTDTRICRGTNFNVADLVCWIGIILLAVHFVRSMSARIQTRNKHRTDTKKG